jgi:hypothetical protein
MLKGKGICWKTVSIAVVIVLSILAIARLIKGEPLEHYQSDNPNYHKVMGGSWKDSCIPKSYDMVKDIVYAVCRPIKGRYRDTSLNSASKCKEAENDNGNLICRGSKRVQNKGDK